MSIPSQSAINTILLPRKSKTRPKSPPSISCSTIHNPNIAQQKSPQTSDPTTGTIRSAFEIAAQLSEQSSPLEPQTLSQLLHFSTQSNSLNLLRKIHNHLTTHHPNIIDDPHVVKTLASLYCKLGSKREARTLLEPKGASIKSKKQEAYEKVIDLHREIREAGYVPDTRYVLHDIDEEAKERALMYHSERLAIAFGLISTKPGSTLRIMKNLRICGDCHNAVKYISKVEGRELIVRDNKRFHHFKDGVCSCGDFW